MARKKSFTGVKSVKNPGGKTAGGEHPGGVVAEAAGILRAEGYEVSKMIMPDSPFNLKASRDHHEIKIRAVRAKKPVRNAREARETYEEVIRTIRPLWHSEADDLQLMIISRKSGVLRFNVFIGGIWNTKTREKSLDKVTEQENPCMKCAYRRTRMAESPSAGTGVAGASVRTTGAGGIISES
jgi:hypothetical protein